MSMEGVSDTDRYTECEFEGMDVAALVAWLAKNGIPDEFCEK